MRLRRIGTVRNPIKRRGEVGLVGAPSTVVVLPRYRHALEGLQPGSHVWVLCWLHRADRRVLRVVPRKISSSLAERGVFATRSPDRPNPVSLTCAKLLSVKGRVLTFDLLDVLDRTPVLDLKLYSAGIDCVPCARRPDYARRYSLMPDSSLRVMLRMVARRATGRLSGQGRLAADLVFRYVRASGRAPESGPLRVATNLSGDGIDALHGLFALRPSSGAVRAVRDRRSPWLEVRLAGGRLFSVQYSRPHHSSS